MTLPFENDTGALVKRYAEKSIRTGRAKSFLSILTILLSAALLSAALLSGFILSVAGMATQTKRGLLTSNHALYYNINDNQIQALRQDERLQDSRIFMQASNTQIENYLVIPVYVEQNGSNIAVDEIVEGHYPTGLYDVAVDKAYLTRLGLPAELGAEITIPFYDGNTETFTVIGLTDNGSSERAYTLYCSEKYAKEGGQFEHSATALLVQLEHANQMSGDAFKETVNKIGLDYGIPSQYSDYNDAFANSLEPNSEDLTIIAIFSLAVLFVSYLVIYSIFYIYAQNQAREFGQLRTMGATSKQIKRILLTQGKVFCICGTIPGLVIGGFAAFLFKPHGWSFRNAILASAAVLVLVYGMIRLAMSKPAKIAGSISPIDAAKNTGYQLRRTVSKKLHRKITPFSLAATSSSRNRKKWMVTVLSLGAAGILFMSGTTLLSSLDMERFSRHGLLEYGEFEMNLSGNAKRNDPHGQTGLQLDNPLNSALIQTIKQMDGVADVAEYKTLETRFDYNGASARDMLAPFTREQQTLLEQYLAAGSIDYRSMISNKEILVLRNAYADYVYDWTFQTGDIVKFRWYNGKEYQEAGYKIAGVISDDIFKDEIGGKLFAKTGFFLLPDELLKEMMIPGFNFNSQLLIRIDDLSQEPAVREKMNEIIAASPMVTMWTLYDAYQDSRAMYQRTSLVIWGLSCFTMLFAVINLINTLTATALSRKHEFSVLRAIGMGKMQLQRTIQFEGIFMAFWNIGITFIVGTSAGYAIVRYLNSVGDDTWVWRFPALYFLGYIAVSILLPAVVSAAVIHILQKKSVVEQLREAD